MGQIRHEETSPYWKKDTDSDWDKLNNREKERSRFWLASSAKSSFLANMSFGLWYTLNYLFLMKEVFAAQRWWKIQCCPKLWQISYLVDHISLYIFAYALQIITISDCLISEKKNLYSWSKMITFEARVKVFLRWSTLFLPGFLTPSLFLKILLWETFASYTKLN